MSLSFYSNDNRRISLPHPLPLEGVCIWDRVMAELGMWIINNDSWFMGINSRKIWAKYYKI